MAAAQALGRRPWLAGLFLRARRLRERLLIVGSFLSTPVDTVWLARREEGTDSPSFHTRRERTKARIRPKRPKAPSLQHEYDTICPGP